MTAVTDGVKLKADGDALAEVKSELLGVLRARLSNEAILNSHHLIEWLRLPWPNSAPAATAVQVRLAIIRAIGYAVDADLRPALQAMCGLIESTKGHNATRGVILEEMAKVLPRRTRSPLYDVKLTRRRVEVMEREVLVPAVIEALQHEASAAEAYDAVDIRMTIRDGASPGYLAMTLEFSGDVVLDQWVVGVTGDELTADYVCGLTDGVNEMLCPGRIRTESDIPVLRVAMRPLLARRPRAVPLPFRRETSDTIAALLECPSLADLDEVRWFVAAIPEAHRREPARLTFTSEHRIQYSCRYSYWSAARRMYVRSITVDASEFPERPRRVLCLQPFLVTPAVGGHRELEGIYELAVDGFVEPGNGVAFIWGDRE